MRNRIAVYRDEILESNCYVIYAEDHKCFVIDPNNIDAILEYTKGYEIEYIGLTHEHYDHIAALNALRKITDAKVICSQVCSERMQDADKNLSSIFKVQLHFMGKDPDIVVEPYHCEPADITYTESFAMEWEGISVCFFRAPGHSPGSAMIVFDDVIFVGDSLSLDHDVIIRKRYGSKDDYRKIVVPFLLAKSQESMIYPGHGKNFWLSQRITYLESIKNR